MDDRSGDPGGGPPRIREDVLADPARLKALADTGLAASADDALDRFARLVSDLLDVPVALVSLVSTDQQFFPGAVGLPPPWHDRRQSPLTHSFCQHVVNLEAPLVLPDVRQSAQVCTNPAIAELGVVAYAGMPLTDLEGRVLGSLCAIDTKPREWSAAQLQTLADLAAACSSELRLRIALDGAEEARHRAEEAQAQLAALASLTETLAGTLDVDTALGRLGELMVPLLADWCLVTLVDPAGRPQHVTAAHRDLERTPEALRFATLMLTELGAHSITRSVLRSGEPVLRSSADPDDMHTRVTSAEMPAIAARLGYASHLTVPIPAAGVGTVLGCISLVNGPDRRPLGPADLRTAMDVGRRAGLAVSNSRTYGEQRRVAEVLQQSMLPRLPAPRDIALAARYQPAADRVEVGGDWYDAFVQPDGTLITAIGDVAGHDIEAAATMGQLRNLVRGNAYGRSDAVEELVTHLDDAIRGLRIPTAATAVLARLRGAPGGGQEVSWCNAGHPPPLVVRADGEVEILHGQPEPLLGLRQPVTRSSRTVHLACGDTLLLYTDGLIERRDQIVDEGLARLVDQLTGAGTLPLPDLCDLLLRQAESREDDIALLAVRAA